MEQMEDIEKRLKRLEKENEQFKKGDRIRGKVLIGEASNSIQLLLEYIISVNTQTTSLFGKSIEKLEKDLGLKDAYHRQYKSLTESYKEKSRGSDDMTRRLECLVDMKRKYEIDPETENFITETVRNRDGEVHVKWNDANYALLQHYIENEKLAEPKKYIPDVVGILKSLYMEARKTYAQRQVPEPEFPPRQCGGRMPSDPSSAMQTRMAGASAVGVGKDSPDSWKTVRGKTRKRGLLPN